MANLVVNGAIKEAGKRVFTPNYAPVLTGTYDSNQYTASYYFDLTTDRSDVSVGRTIDFADFKHADGHNFPNNGVLSDNQAVSAVYAFGLADSDGGTQNNACLWVLTSYSATKQKLTVNLLRRVASSIFSSTTTVRISVTVLTLYYAQPSTSAATRLSVSGQINVGTGNNPPRVRTTLPVLKLTSGCHSFRVSDVTTNATSISGTTYTFFLNSTDLGLTSGEFITAVYAMGYDLGGASDNDAIWQLASYAYSDGTLQVTVVRLSNDHASDVKIVVSTVKVSTVKVSQLS